MTRRKKEVLRELTTDERSMLERISRSQSEPASHVIHAKEILAVAGGKNYTEAAAAVGRRSGDPVSKLVSEFNRCGLAALQTKHGGGPPLRYGAPERERILRKRGANLNQSVMARRPGRCKRCVVRCAVRRMVCRR